MTIFIVLGILVLMIVAGIMYAVNMFTSEQLKAETPETQTSFISAFVNNCLEKATIKGMEIVFAQGGYYRFPPNLDIFSFEDEKLEVPVYFQNNKVELPAIPEIETEVSRAANVALLECVGTFETFEKQGYVITAEEPNVQISFTEKTSATVRYPLTITKEGEETSVSTFSLSLPFNFPEKYSTLKEYLSKQEAGPNYFLAGELSTAAYQKNYGFGFKQFGDVGNTVLVTLSYPEKIGEEPLNYNFALNFNWVLGSEKAETKEPSLLLLRISQWNITAPGVQTLAIEAVGEELSFRTDPDTLPIDAKTGLITLDTKDFPNDEYLYYVIVTDKLGQQLAAPISINVNANDGTLPVIEPIKKQVAKVGEEFKYKVTVANPEGLLLFTTDSYLFDIDAKTGGITFTPTKEEKGTHDIRVDVENEFGKTWQRFELEIQ